MVTLDSGLGMKARTVTVAVGITIAELIGLVVVGYLWGLR